MLSHKCAFLCAALFLFTGYSAFETKPPGCQLKVVNTGVEGYPNYGTTTCVGDCVDPEQNPCTVNIWADDSLIQFRCYCDGTRVTTGTPQGCAGNLERQDGGSWHIFCFQGSCVATCLPAGLPAPGAAVIACTCPDA